MKFAVKNLSLFIVLAVILSVFSGCKTTTSNNNSALPKGDYPPAPSGIAQAELTKLDGSGFKIEDYKGKVVLVNLWGIWCAPCRDEIPEFIKLKEENRDKGFEVIGLNVGDENGEVETKENLQNFIEKYKINYEISWANEKLNSEFLKISKVNAVPQSFLIDRDGRLVGVFIGAGKSVDKVKENVRRVVAN